jgi:hypothetical protein
MKYLPFFFVACFFSTGLLKAQTVPYSDGGWSSSATNATADTGDYITTESLPPQSLGSVCGPFPVTSQTGQPIVSEVATPEIVSLAANLQNDPRRIFDYVHNNIKYVHYFGAKKGALLTMLEGSGNDFDQCALFTALIRAASTNSGNSYAVHYQFGLMQMPYSASSSNDLQHWLGLNVPPFSAGTSGGTLSTFLKGFNYLRNYPTYENVTGIDSLIVNNDGTYNNFLFHRLWVRLTVNGTNYFLDPAVKFSTYTPGISVTNKMGFNAPTVFSQAGAGATINSNYVQSLNWANLSNTLTGYTTNLLTYLTTNPNISVEQAVSGYDIQQSIS